MHYHDFLVRFRKLVTERESIDLLSVDIDTSCTLVELLGLDFYAKDKQEANIGTLETVELETEKPDMQDSYEEMAWGVSMIKPDIDTIVSIREGYEADVFFNKIIKILIALEKNPMVVVPKDMKFTCSNEVQMGQCMLTSYYI